MSLETPIKIRRLQRKLYQKAKEEPSYRFYQLYDKMYREDILAHAYALVKSNGLAGPRLVILKSLYRFVIRPILDYALDLEKNNPGRQIAVLTPELVERRWYLNLLHNHRSAALKALLLFQGDRRITVINIPWYLTDQDARP